VVQVLLLLLLLLLLVVQQQLLLLLLLLLRWMTVLDGRTGGQLVDGQRLPFDRVAVGIRWPDVVVGILAVDAVRGGHAKHIGHRRIVPHFCFNFLANFTKPKPKGNTKKIRKKQTKLNSIQHFESAPKKGI